MKIFPNCSPQPLMPGRCYLVVRLPSAAKACSSCTMRSYTRKVIALWGMTRKTWGAMPLYRPLAPSRAMMVRNACLVFPYRSTRPASWRCCTLVRTTCGWELVRACLHVCQLVSASRVFGEIGGRVALTCSSCSGHSQPGQYQTTVHCAKTARRFIYRTFAASHALSMSQASMQAACDRLTGQHLQRVGGDSGR